MLIRYTVCYKTCNMTDKVEIKYEKFRASIWKNDVCIKGFSCYITEHAWTLAKNYLRDNVL